MFPSTFSLSHKELRLRLLFIKTSPSETYRQMIQKPNSHYAHFSLGERYYKTLIHLVTFMKHTLALIFNTNAEFLSITSINFQNLDFRTKCMRHRLVSYLQLTSCSFSLFLNNLLHFPAKTTRSN